MPFPMQRYILLHVEQEGLSVEGQPPPCRFIYGNRQTDMTKNVTFPQSVAGRKKFTACIHRLYLQMVISLFPMSHILTVSSHLPVFVMNDGTGLTLKLPLMRMSSRNNRSKMVLEEH